MTNDGRNPLVRVPTRRASVLFWGVVLATTVLSTRCAMAQTYITTSGVGDVWLSDQPTPGYIRTTFEQAEASDHLWLVVNGSYPHVIARQGVSATLYTNYHCNSTTEVGISTGLGEGWPPFYIYINQRGQRSRCGHPSSAQNGTLYMFREHNRLVFYFQKH